MLPVSSQSAARILQTLFLHFIKFISSQPLLIPFSMDLELVSQQVLDDE
jgi:hypothetical protein